MIICGAYMFELSVGKGAKRRNLTRDVRVEDSPTFMSNAPSPLDISK